MASPIPRKDLTLTHFNSLEQNHEGLSAKELEELLQLAQNGKAPTRAKSKKSPPKGLKDKFKQFWKATQEAGKRHDRLNPWEKLQQQFWMFNVGQVKGLVRGLYEGAGHLVNPRSSFHQVSPSQVHKDVSNFGEGFLDYGTRYMKADWGRRGEMIGEASVKAGLWVLSLRNAQAALMKIVKGSLK